MPGDYTMDHTTMLTELLKVHLGWHLARIKCLSALLVALVKVKTVNLAEVATAFPGPAQSASHYRRLQRFFQYVEIKPAFLAQLVVSFLPYVTYTLALDRTNWMLGCFSINFLVLSVVHDGIAFPILWTFLPKKGNSNTKERIALLEQFIAVFGTHKIECLLADREFLGHEWFAYLQAHHIRFYIRVKRDMTISRTNGTLSPALNFFRSLPVSTYCLLPAPRHICGHLLYVTGMRLPSGDYLIIVSNDTSPEAIEIYKKRWKIEVLFQALKSRGFNFEDTHLKDTTRLKTLFAVLAMAFCWAYHVGAWRHAVKPLRLKKHQRPAKSIFRYGFDWIRQAVLNPEDQHELLTHVLTLLRNALMASRFHIYQLYPM
jgi:Transposase DDE domain